MSQKTNKACWILLESKHLFSCIDGEIRANKSNTDQYNFEFRKTTIKQIYVHFLFIKFYQ